MSKKSYVCVACMEPSSSLYQRYSEGVIRLSDCKKCGEVVDKYVEYDIMLVIIDLIIHNISAYRHLIYNMNIQKSKLYNMTFNLTRESSEIEVANPDKLHTIRRSIKRWLQICIPYLLFAFHQFRLAVIFLFCDAYDKWISGRVGIYNIYDLEWIFYKSLLQSAIEMSTYVAFIMLCELVKTLSFSRIPLVSRGTIIGYYGNVAVVFSIIFRLSSEFSYRAVTELFIFISHIQIQRTLFPDLDFFINFIIVVLGVALSKYCGQMCRSILEY